MLNECSISDCHDQAVTRGWCTKHYTRWLRHGDPLAVAAWVADTRTRLDARTDMRGGLDTCHLWQGPPDSEGYGRMDVGGRKLRVHVIAWELENGPVPPGMAVDHECHNRAVQEGLCRPGKCMHRLCRNERHLMAKPPAQHIQDSPPHDHPRGAAHPRAVLTEQEVVEIRALLTRGMIQRRVAVRYGITRSTVSAIKDRRSWAWL